MAYLRIFALVAGVIATTSISAVAQEPPPTGPFRAVHLVSLTPQQVAMLQAWMADMNAAIAKAGHTDVRYRLFKVVGKQAGPYEYMWESSWPGASVYKKVHSLPEWKTIGSKYPGLSELTKDETYNRYVEVSPPAR